MKNQLDGLQLSFSKPVIFHNFLWLIFISLVMSVIYLGLNQRVDIKVYDNYLFPVELKIPFLPESALLYWLVLLLVFAVALMIAERQHFYRVMTTNIFSFSLNACIWWLWPVGYSRPVSEQVDDHFYELLIGIDSPLNSFPSGHISLLCLLCWVAWSYQKPTKYILLILAVIGVVTVFTTKQHSFVDAIGGVITMLLALISTQALFSMKKFK